jgi:hypothetical protein
VGDGVNAAFRKVERHFSDLGWVVWAGVSAVADADVIVESLVDIGVGSKEASPDFYVSVE